VLKKALEMDVSLCRDPGGEGGTFTGNFEVVGGVQKKRSISLSHLLGILRDSWRVPEM
jgi:hypothetical protein